VYGGFTLPNPPNIIWRNVNEKPNQHGKVFLGAAY